MEKPLLSLMLGLLYYERMDTQNINLKTAIIAVVAIAVIAGAILYYKSRSKPIKSTEGAIKALTDTNIEIQTNPVANKIPELNPVDKTNPFKNAYKNPFSQ